MNDAEVAKGRGLACLAVATMMMVVPAPASVGRAANAAAGERLGGLPLVFEPNRGQAAPDVRFLARTAESTLLLTEGEAIFLVPEDPAAVPGPRVPGLRGIRMRLTGASPGAGLRGENTGPGRTHYLRGTDSRKWIRDVPHLGAVRRDEVYPGIDLVFRDSGAGRLEYDFHLAPGADPAAIVLHFPGVDEVTLQEDGDLRVRRGGATLVHRAPRAFQPGEAGPEPVDSVFVRLGRDGARFRVGPYDPERPLVIDPVTTVAYSSYLGGWTSGPDAFETATAVAVDGSGAAYVTGYTTALTGFPVSPSAFQPIHGGSTDAFISKVRPDGSALEWSTFVGGQLVEKAWDIAVTDRGEPVVVGETFSDDFPVSPDALQGSRVDAREWEDIFILKLRPDASDIVWSTYLGGEWGDQAYGVALDPEGNIYVAGHTESTDFPIVSAFQPVWGQGVSCHPQVCPDAFVLKVPADASSLLYSSFLGGPARDFATDVAADGAGHAYVTGYTNSLPSFFLDGFPITDGAYQTELGTAEFSAFVTKVSPGGTSLVYSTYLGGPGDNRGRAIAVDTFGAAYVAGSTDQDFPITSGTLKEFCFDDAFVAKLSPDGSSLLYGACLGGNLGTESAEAVQVDDAGNAYIAGATVSDDFPLVNPVQPIEGGSEAFLAMLNPDASVLRASTTFGGSAEEVANGLALGPAGDLFLVGRTTSEDYPIHEPFQEELELGEDAFIARFFLSPNLVVDIDSIGWDRISLLERYDVTYDRMSRLTELAGPTPEGATGGCLGDNITANQVAFSQVPPPSDGFWFLVRPVLGAVDGTYGSGDAVAPRDQWVAALGCGSGCAHGLCAQGELLEAGCDPCVDQICDQEPSCCSDGWDELCVEQVRTVCMQPICTESQGSCTHTLCQPGSPFTGECGGPPEVDACIGAVCNLQPSCCTDVWDAACVQRVEEACSLTCG